MTQLVKRFGGWTKGSVSLLLLAGLIWAVNSQTDREEIPGMDLLGAQREIVPPGEVGETGFFSIHQTRKRDWVPLNFKRFYQNPVILLAPQTAKGIEPLIARARNVTPAGCEVRLEWATNSEGIRFEEDVAYLVIEAGRHVLADGTVIDAGNRRVGMDWKTIRFLDPLPSRGRVVCQAISAANPYKVIIPRIGWADRDGFQVRIDTEEALNDQPRRAEWISWVAVSRPLCITDTSMIRAGVTTRKVDEHVTRVGLPAFKGETPAFFASVVSVADSNPVIPRIKAVRPEDAWFLLQEDYSADPETGHREENVHWLAVSPGIISTAQTDTDGDSLPDAYERYRFKELTAGANGDPDQDGINNRDELRLGLNPNQFDARPLIMTWSRPILQDSREGWTGMSFGEEVFSNPVVVASLQSNFGETLVTPRIRDMSSVGFDLQLEECAHDDGVRELEQVGILAMEAGRYEFPGGGFIEGGLADVSDAGWHTVEFQSAFAESPVIFTQVVSERDGTPVFVRVDEVDGARFKMILREEEALISEEHGTESVAWIAVSPGIAETWKGKITAEHLPSIVDHQITEVEVDFFGRTGPGDKPHPGIYFAQMQSDFEGDTANIGLHVSRDTMVALRVVEESSQDSETTHVSEAVGLLSMPRGVLAFVPCAVDQDGDGLVDSLEEASGLSATARSTVDNKEGFYGDADGDGIPNGVEARRGLPLDSPRGVIEWEVYTNIPERRVARMTRTNKFVRGQSEVHELPRLETPRFFMDNFGSRIRGYLIAPSDGTYTFFVTGDNETRLFLSSDNLPFNKKLIARVGPGAKLSDPNDWFGNPEHVSAPVFLEAGESYYLEVLQKDDTMDDFLQVGWIRPGQDEVEVISAEHWTRFRPIPGDKDDDSLPDRWEQMTGLESENVFGEQDRNQAEYGDPDPDHLTNFEEWQIGTSPIVADTDGDGVDDGSEVREFKTNPLLPPDRFVEAGDALPFPYLRDFASSSGPWGQVPGGGIAPATRNGWLKYRFTTPTDGFWIYQIGAKLNNPRHRSTRLSILVDGIAVGAHEVRHPSGRFYVAKGRTPHLAAGAHELEIRNDNVSVDLRLAILSVGIFTAGGIDSDGNGIPNWLQEDLARANRIDSKEYSFVSPACVEGAAVYPEDVELENGNGDPIDVHAGLTGRWFANVPLRSADFTVVKASFEHGAVEDEIRIDWRETAVSENDAIRIRIGDTLRIVPGAIDSATGTPELIRVRNSSTNEVLAVHSLADQPHMIHQFDRVGEFEIRVQSDTGTLAGSMKVSVVASDFGPGTSAIVGAFNYWTIPEVPWSVSADPDPVMEYLDYQGDAGTRAAWLDPGRAGNMQVLARVEPGGLISAAGKVNGIEIATVNDTRDNRIIETYPDGDRLLRSTFALTGALPAGWYVEVRGRASGVLFDDGNRIQKFFADDFDEFGIATMHMYVPREVPTRNCHYMLLFNAEGNLVASL